MSQHRQPYKDLIYRSKNMNQKVNAMFGSLIKIEQLCYKMKIRKLGKMNIHVMQKVVF